MLTNQEIEDIVRELFYQEIEGEYWDFKEKPYFKSTEGAQNAPTVDFGK